MSITRPRPRLKDLAEALDLSVTTVSRALGGHDDVSQETQQRVKSKAEQMGYVPSRAGRMLVSGATRSVCLVIPAHDPTFIDPFLGAFVTSLGEGLAEHDLDLFIRTVSRGQCELEVIQDIMSTGRADAVVITRTERDDPRVRFLIDQNFPFVSHGRVKSEGRAYAWYDSDGEQAFEMATELLIGLGHHRFAYLGIEEPFSFVDYRWSGMEKALANAGLALPPSHRISPRRGCRDGVLVACHSVLDLDPRPTAVLAAVDELALCLLDVATEREIAIPNELSVIGFDNLPVSAYAKPPLSTFDHEPGGSAAHVAAMLADQIDKPDAPREPLLAPARFVPRASHGPAAGQQSMT